MREIAGSPIALYPRGGVSCRLLTSGALGCPCARTDLFLS
jgi:hypothetical protein